MGIKRIIYYNCDRCSAHGGGGAGVAVPLDWRYINFIQHSDGKQHSAASALLCEKCWPIVLKEIPGAHTGKEDKP